MDNKVGMKIKTLTLMRKLTTWETKEVFKIITLDIRVIILEMQVRTTLEMEINMVNHQI